MSIRLATALAAAAFAAGCGGIPTLTVAPPQRAHFSTITAILRGSPMELHLAAPPSQRAPDVLVLYASGDGGWFGAAADMFRTIGDAGFYGVGVSTRSLLHRESVARGSPGIGDLASDYQALLDQAAPALHLPASRRVVLTGWSRGASLAVLVGGPDHAPRGLAGVVAIGLAADEDLTLRQDSDDDPIAAATGSQGPTPGPLDLYELLGAIAPHRCAVIQATGDRYLPAVQARARFGGDTANRRLFEIEASNHRFSGAGRAFADRFAEALRWVVADDARRAGE